MRHPIPNDALESGMVSIIGKRGTGKTVACKSMIARLIHRGRRVLCIDPVGVHWGLKLAADGVSAGLRVLVIGGTQADIPIPDSDERTAERIADLILATDVSVVLDVADFKRRECLAFVTVVLRRLYEKHSGSAWYLVLEEADLFAPNMPKSVEEKECLAECEHLARRGRTRGFMLITVTQRPASISKGVLTQFDTMAVFALPGRHDREAIRDWLQGVVDDTACRDVFNSLPQLEVGTAWI